MEEQIKIYGFSTFSDRIMLTLRKSAVQDTVYGTGRFMSQEAKCLRLVENGVILSGEETKARLALPIWGPGNQTFEQLIPVLPPPVPESLPSGTWPWIEYKQADASTHPTADPWQIWTACNVYSVIYGNTRYWECLLADGSLWNGEKTTHLYHDQRWPAVGVVKYRRWKHPYVAAYIPNPDYQPREAERAALRASYKEIVFNILTPIGRYAFVSLPYGEDPLGTNPANPGYLWEINGEMIPVDPAHKYAVENLGGFKSLPAPMHNPEIVKTAYRSKTAGLYYKYIDHYDKTLEAAISASLDVQPYDARVNQLLSI